MRITRWGEYGVHCAVAIARNQGQGSESSSAHEIADEYKIAVDYAQQILQRLRRAGLIESVRGPHGGYRLARPSDQITLGDILNAAEGSVFNALCSTNPIDSERCSESISCGLRELWGELEDHLEAFLKGVTLTQLVARLTSQEKLVTLGARKQA